MKPKLSIPLDRSNSAHRIEFNRIHKYLQKIEGMNRDRKAQMERWNTFLRKLLKDGRITKEELASVTPKRQKQKN